MSGQIQSPVVRPRPPTQTHMVLSGKCRLSAYQDGEVLRAVEDGRQLAFRKPDGAWSRPVRESKARRPGPYDSITPKYPAEEVHLDKGKCY